MKNKIFLNDNPESTAVATGSILLSDELIAGPALTGSPLLNPGDTRHTGIIPSCKNVTTVVKLNRKDVKIHALCTGTVAVKTNFRKKNGIGELARLNMLLDRHYTEYMPIWVWVIEHPEGLMIIDTGEIAAVKNIGKYLAKERAFFRYFFKHSAKFDVDEKDELNYQFEKINLRLDDVKLVVLTHLHLDHTDGLKFFPKQEIIVGDTEFAHASGNMPTTYPSWFKPNKVNYKQNRIDIFDEAYPITSAEDLMYVPTPGHTHGHSSVIFKTDDFDVLFAGDISYYQEQVLNNELAGVNADYSKSGKTYKKVKEYAANHKTIYLPSHDQNSAVRLSNKEFLV